MDERNFDGKLGWREALSFEHAIKGWQYLWIRFATDLDIKKEETKGENSRFYKFAQRTASQLKSSTWTSQRPSVSRFGSHPGDRNDRRSKEERRPAKVGNKVISKPEKYRAAHRNARKKEVSEESSDLDDSDRSKGRPLDDGQTRSEVDVNFISKSAGILKAETMQEQARGVAQAEIGTAERTSP